MRRPVRLLVVAAAPVFYQAPLYRRVAADPAVDFTALFLSSAGVRPYEDVGFGGLRIAWSDDQLEGYKALFVPSAAHNRPNPENFFGLDDRAVGAEVARHDVVWVHGYSYAGLMRAIVRARLAGKPVLLREEQTLLHGRPLVRRIPRGVVLRLVFRQTYGLAIGTNNRAFLRHYGLAEERIFDVPYCVDNERLRAAERELGPQAHALRATMGLDDGGGPVILFVGKFIKNKRPDLLLEAFRRVRARRRCQLLFVGAGEMDGALRRRVRDQAIPDVRFAGFLNRDEIARAYVAADLFVLPSQLNETWGLVVNEAMNFGLPVVVSDKVGCAADLVSGADTGFVFKSADVDDLADRLERVVADDALRRRMGARARAHVEHWNYDRAAAGVIAAATSVTVGRPRSGT